MADIEDYISHESNLNYKSIYCEQIPELFLDKLVAKKHFGKYGKITRFILRPKRLCCTVEYETEDQAEKALLEGGNYNGFEFSITYAEREVAHVQNTEEWVDPDVQAELEAMNPSQRNNNTLALRPAMQSQTTKISQPRYTIKPTNMQMPPTPPSAKLIQKADVEVLKVDPAVRQELEATLKKQAFSVEDKYRVLDARDKLIRLMTVRQTDIKKAVSAKGTCPDMCPEKERLMREFQRQVASFEMSTDETTNGSAISHRRAIKEYSRSSADQEVPLSHELRSENVLQMTMLYLMHCIIDLCDDAETSLADWFHFVWDRTRSIRKDITQQEMCSLGSVQLVEQCARFHIHCAARLIAEEPSVFDKKINAENLTKCLQTLKYMYHDLRQKAIYCPCEAEFRSYIVLLNLGDANFLWELKQLPEQIQNSQEIKHALNFYNALQNNNFVRFFNLVRSKQTSYLSGCILLRYFTKLRLRAMDAIIKSHKGKQDVFLPLAYITRVLGFEDEISAASFLTYHGLQCDEERVLLDRMSKPDLEYSMERALLLVESKRTVSVGECVCGHQLESSEIFEKHRPQNSFDVNCLLKAEAWPTGLLPTMKTDVSSLFKVPQASPPISSKQQQQQRLQQQQLRNIFASDSKSIVAAIPQQQPTPIASIFGNRSVSDSSGSSGSIFGAPKNDSSVENNIFKVPAFNATANQFSTQTPDVAADNIFMKNPAKPAKAVGSIFGGIKSSGTNAAATTNIFAQITPKGNENIFQQPQPLPQQLQLSQAPPLLPQVPPFKQESIFKNIFNTQPAFNQLTPMPALSTKPTPTPISNFTPLIHTTNRDPRLGMTMNDFETQKQTESLSNTEAAAKRMRELEEEQKLKQKQLEEERAKLKALEEQRARINQDVERKRMLQIRAQKMAEQELSSFLLKDITTIAHAELAKYRKVDRESQRLGNAIIADVLDEQITEIAMQEYTYMCRNQLLLQNYFEQWLQHVRKKRQQRKLMESMPVWVTTATLAEKTAQMQHPCQSLNLSMIKRYRHGEPVNFQHLLWQARNNHIDEIRLNLCQLLTEYSGGSVKQQLIQPGRMQLRKYCKLLLTLPAEMEELPGFESMCNKWLQKHVQVPKQRSTITPAAFYCAMEDNVALCARKLTGVNPKNELGQYISIEANHVDGIICFMTANNLQNTRKRLHQLVKLSHNYKPVSIAFITYDCQYEPLQLAEILELDALINDAQLSGYEFFGCLEFKNQFSFVAHFNQAMRFIATAWSNKETYTIAVETLEVQSFESWLDASLGEEQWLRWHTSALKNPAFSKLCSMPEHVIGLYNEAIKCLQNIITEDLDEAPEFPQELREFVPELPKNMNTPMTLPYFPDNWKSKKLQNRLYQLLQKLQLPAVSIPIPTDVEDLQIWLLNYASRCIPSDDMKATAAAHEAIKALIKQLNRPDLIDLPIEQRMQIINQLPVIKALAFAHIIQQLQKESASPLTHVIYNRERLVDYQKQPWWLNYAPIEAITVDYSSTTETSAVRDVIAETTTTSTDLTLQMDAIIERAEEASRNAEMKLNTIKNITLNAYACDLKRQLDESFYQFDLAKQFGCFNEPTNMDEPEDNELTDCTNNSAYGNPKNSISTAKKRKRPLQHHNDHNNADDDINAIIAKAMNVIEKVECKQDRYARFKHAERFLNLNDLSV